MAFHSPNFNLMCNIWHGAFGPPLFPPTGPPSLTSQCQLRYYKTGAIVQASDFGYMWIDILFPKGTDVRPETGFHVLGTGFSMVECPAGSGRYYYVVTVDDAAKGFSNEYRIAVCRQFGYTGGYPIT